MRSLLLFTVLTLPAQELPCPPEASGSGCQVRVAAFDTAGTILNRPLEAGESIDLRVILYYTATDPISGATLSAFKGGNFYLLPPGATEPVNVTPPAWSNWVVGPPARCSEARSTFFESSPVRIKAWPYENGNLMIRGFYRDGIALLPNFPPIQAENVTAFPVNPASPIHITSTNLWWIGRSGVTYTLESSTNLVEWTPEATLPTPDTLKIAFPVSPGKTYRYRFLP